MIRYYDADLAKAITESGQAALKELLQHLKEHGIEIDNEYL